MNAQFRWHYKSVWSIGTFELLACGVLYNPVSVFRIRRPFVVPGNVPLEAPLYMGNFSATKLAFIELGLLPLKFAHVESTRVGPSSTPVQSTVTWSGALFDDSHVPVTRAFVSSFA